jgi:hypothetical protein
MSGNRIVKDGEIVGGGTTIERIKSTFNTMDIIRF